MWLCEHCIADRMMESYCDAFHIRGYRRRSKKLMMVCTELTNPDLSLETGLEDLAIIGQKWSLTLLPTLSDAMPIRSTVTSSIKHRDISTNVFFMIIWDAGNGCYRTHQPSNIHRTSFRLGHNWLLLKIGGSHSLEGSKNIKYDQVHQASRTLPYRCTLTNYPR